MLDIIISAEEQRVERKANLMSVAKAVEDVRKGVRQGKRKFHLSSLHVRSTPTKVRLKMKRRQHT